MLPANKARARLNSAMRIPQVIRSYGGMQTIPWVTVSNQCVQCRYSLMLGGEPLHVTVIADRANKSTASIHRAAAPWDIPLPTGADALAQSLLDVGAIVRVGNQLSEIKND